MESEEQWQKGIWRMNRHFIFNNIDFLEKYDVYIDSMKTSGCEKIEHGVSIPYRSGEYDMDKAIGYPTYSPRIIQYTCQMIEASTYDLDLVLTALTNDLLAPVEAVLRDTGTPNYHYTGKCTSVDATTEKGYAEIVITFKCHPFKILEESVANYLWDTFDLEYGEIPQRGFTIHAQETITLKNNGVAPVQLKSNSLYASTMVVDGITYSIGSGEQILPFKLIPGINEITVGLAQLGLIEFDWTEELI